MATLKSEDAEKFDLIKLCVLGSSDVYMQADDTNIRGATQDISKKFQWEPVGTPIEKALVTFYTEQLDQVADEDSVKDQLTSISRQQQLLARLPFDQEKRRKVTVRQINEESVRIIVQGSPIAILSELTDDWETFAQSFSEHATTEHEKIISYASKTISLEEYNAKVDELAQI
jgi:magnesium-transporting ATPase (P-type)